MGQRLLTKFPGTLDQGCFPNINKGGGTVFHIEEKLRTVIWDFAGELIPDNLVANLRQFRHLLDINDNTQPGAVPSELVTSLSDYLSSAEISAIAQRSDPLLDSARFPDPNPDRRHYPWPAV